MEYLREISLFVAVAELESFTKAAIKLGIPVSSLSRRVAALERAIGLRLLNRNTRSLSLTEAGQLYLARCEAVIAAIEEANREVHGLIEEPRGTLRLSVDAEIGARLVAPVIVEFAARFPKMRIEIDLSPRRIDLQNENYDLAIRIGALPDSDLRVRRLASLRSGLYAAPSYLAGMPRPTNPRDLTQHRRIHLLHQGDQGSWSLAHSESGEMLEIAADSIVTANNMTMIRQLALLGLGIAVLDDAMARDDATAGRLTRILPEWGLPSVPLSLITPARHPPAKTRLFTELLARRITGSVGLG